MTILGPINALLPKDSAARRTHQGIAYGPEARHRMDVYAPKEHHGALPLVMFVYGGAWHDGLRAEYGFVGQALAAMGYVVVIPDYRLIPEVEYPKFLEDCALAARHIGELAAQWGADPARIGLMGHSAGAYNALMLALDPDLAAMTGLSGRLRAVVGLSGPYDFFPFDGPISLRTFGAVSEPERTQPISHVRQGLPPMYLGSGNRDRIVLPRNASALASRLRSCDVEVEEQHFERLGHAGPLLSLALPLRWLAPVHAQVKEFLAKHM